MSKQTIVVFGATGNQGGSVINSILADSKASSRFHLKGVTRDPTKESSKALASKGVEVVKVCTSPPFSSYVQEIRERSGFFFF